jgi:predicted nucleic acid-binding protein
MNDVVVDTDIASYVFKNHTLASLYYREIRGGLAYLSFMTIAELRRWTLQAAWGKQRLQSLDEYLQGFVVIPSSPDLCEKWAEVTVAAQAAGRRIDCADAWIAATALLYDLPLITHNRTDYLGVPGLRVISHA